MSVNKTYHYGNYNDSSDKLFSATPPSTPFPLSNGKLYCYKCKSFVSPAFLPAADTPQTCICGNSLIPYQIERLADMLWTLDQLAKNKGNAERQLDELTTTHTRLVQRCSDLIADNTRLRQQLSNHESLYYHPTTNSYVQESETVSAGVIGRMRVGWDGPVYKVTDRADMARMVGHLQQSGRDMQTSSRNERHDQEMDALRREINRLNTENSQLRIASSGPIPVRSRRQMET